MIPILYNGTETLFQSNGLGRITDCLFCEVTEERNGAYILEAIVATTSPVYSNLAVGKIIAVQDNDGTIQAFDIISISKPMNHRVTIKANHISYRLSYIPVKPFTAEGIDDTFQGLLDNALENCPFEFDTDFDNDYSTFKLNAPQSMRACLGGTQGSVLDVFSGGGAGEYAWNNFTVSFLMHRGADRGVELRYGKNIVDFTYSQDIDEVVTGVLPVWHNLDNTIIFYGDIQYSQYASNYPSPRTIVLDLSEQFEEAPAIDELNNAGLEYVTNSSTVLPKDNITLSFVDLSKTGEQAIMEEIFLCDTVTVHYEPLGITYKAQVIKTRWNVLKERFEEIEIGQPKSSLSSTLAKEVTDIAENVTSGKMVSVTQYVDYENGEIKTTLASVQKKQSDMSDDLDYLENNTIATIQENYNNITQTVEGTKQTIGEVQRTVNGNTESTQKLETYITTDITGITIGDNQSDIKGHFGSTSLDFMNVEQRVAWVDGQEQTLGAMSVSLGSPDTLANRWKLTVSDDGEHFRITRHN